MFLFSIFPGFILPFQYFYLYLCTSNPPTLGSTRCHQLPSLLLSDLSHLKAMIDITRLSAWLQFPFNLNWLKKALVCGQTSYMKMSSQSSTCHSKHAHVSVLAVMHTATVTFLWPCVSCKCNFTSMFDFHEHFSYKYWM